MVWNSPICCWKIWEMCIIWCCRWSGRRSTVLPYSTIWLGACRSTLLCDCTISMVPRRRHDRIQCLNNQVLGIEHVLPGIPKYLVYLMVYLPAILKYMGMAHLWRYRTVRYGTILYCTVLYGTLPYHGIVHLPFGTVRYRTENLEILERGEPDPI
jgi:hypothetical protein